ncbi:MAG: FtsX-like permease family protein [Candidatus Bathyarchaeota archaeon]
MQDLGVITRAFRNISRKKIRVLLVVIALGFSMAIMTAIPSSIVANQQAVESLSANYNQVMAETEAQINATLTLVQCSLSSGYTPGFRRGGSAWGLGPSLTGSQQFLNESAVFDISSIQRVEAVIPFLEKTEGTTQTLQTPRGTFDMLVPQYTVVGVLLDLSLINNYAVLPNGILEGRNLQEGDSGVVLLSKNNTGYFGVGVGGSVNILGSSFTVVGVYESADPLQLRKLYMSLSDAQTITNLKGKVSKLDVYASDQSSVDGVVSAIKSLYPEFYITTYENRLSQLTRTTQQYQSTLQNAETSLAQMQSMAFQEVLIAVVATGAIILLMMLYSVRERTKEIGILKAIGFSNWNVMSQFMLEGVLMSLMAGAVGIAIGIVGAPLLSSLLLPRVSLFPTQRTFTGGTTSTGMFQTGSAAITLDPRVMLLSFGAAALLGALGSLYPAWRASRTSPMEALKYE